MNMKNNIWKKIFIKFLKCSFYRTILSKVLFEEDSFISFKMVIIIYIQRKLY